MIFWYTLKWKSNQIGFECFSGNQGLKRQQSWSAEEPVQRALRKPLFSGTIAQSCASIWRQLVMLEWCGSLDNSFLFSVVSVQIDLSPAGCYDAWWTQRVRSAPNQPPCPPTALMQPQLCMTTTLNRRLHSKFRWNHTAPAGFGSCARR